MIIKPCIRAGYRAAASYLKAQGENEKVRLVEINDPGARNLDEAFQSMWETASGTRARKPLLHFSINPYKDERLTDKQVKYIADSYTKRCNLNPSCHQRVIVEHVKDGRQHFHVFVCRVSTKTGKCIDPGKYIIAAKRCAREMEKELGLKSPVPRRMTRARNYVARTAPGRIQRISASTSYCDTGFSKVGMRSLLKLIQILWDAHTEKYFHQVQSIVNDAECSYGVLGDNSKSRCFIITYLILNENDCFALFVALK